MAKRLGTEAREFIRELKKKGYSETEIADATSDKFGREGLDRSTIWRQLQAMKKLDWQEWCHNNLEDVSTAIGAFIARLRSIAATGSVVDGKIAIPLMLYRQPYGDYQKAVIRNICRYDSKVTALKEGFDEAIKGGDKDTAMQLADEIAGILERRLAF